METKKENKKKKEKGGTWRELSQFFTASILSKVGDSISVKFKHWIKDLKKRTLGALLLLIGMIFILICVALYVNTYFTEESSWIGYGFVGILVLGVGYLLSKNN